MSGGRRTNREILTGGKRYVQKQAKKFGVDEVVFDKESRQDYLTGFHKRKLDRQKKAQQYNKEQERLARLAERKRIRDERKQELEERMQAFNKTVQDITNFSDSEEDESWDGFDQEKADNVSESEDGERNSDLSDDETNKPLKSKPKGILRVKEVYKINDPTQFQNTDAVIDEDTTVTVESVDNPLMSNIHQLSIEAKAKANCVDLAKSEEVLEKSIKRAQNYAVTAGVSKPKDRIKKKKFRYLTKTERKANNLKQKVKKAKYKKDAISKSSGKMRDTRSKK